MPVYEYSALDKKGKNTSGIIDAESAAVARQKLRAKAIYPVSIKQVDKASSSESTRDLKSIRLFDRVKSTDISMMTRQLSTLLDAGFPLVTAIDALVPTISTPSFKKIVAQLKTTVVEGSSLANALSAYPKVFSPLYINMVHAGESSGTLEVVLERLADLTEKQDALRSRIRSKMFYPIFMTLFGAAILTFLLTVIVPNITSIFITMEKTLPAPTRFLIATSDLFQSYWWLIFLIVFAALYTIRRINRTVKGRVFFDRLKLSMPLFGPLSQKLAVARFSRTLSSLLENGVTMLTALDIVKNIVGNVIISKAVEDICSEVGKGQAVGQSMSAHAIFPHLAVQMVQVGEQSGDLESMLNKLANIYESESESTIMGMTSLLEPIMILLMGVVVGLIVLSIMLPIIEMNQLVS
jgi:general secretion pathway protein F